VTFTIKQLIMLTVVVAVVLASHQWGKRQAFMAGFDKGWAEGRRQEATDQNYQFGWRLSDRLERLESRINVLDL